MKKFKFLLPVVAIAFAAVGAFATESMVADRYSFVNNGTCDPFVDCSASSGTSCSSITIFDNTTCSLPTVSLTGNVKQ